MKSVRFLVAFFLIASCCLSGCTSSVALRRVLVPPPEPTFRVSGYVLDSVSRKPVAGAFMHDAKWGNYFGQPQTDSSGHFVLHLPVSSRRLNCRLIVQTVLYEGHAAIPTDATAEMNILLHRNKYRLPSDECNGTVDSLRMSPYASQGELFPGYKLALFIGNKLPPLTRTISAIIINQSLLKLERGCHWLRIYPARGPLQHFDGNLIDNGFALNIENEAEAIQYFDIKSSGIVMPSECLLIEVEQVVGADKCYCIRSSLNFLPNGPLLSPPCTLADAHNWLYDYKTGWRRLTPAENPVPLYHQAIQVELVPPK